jgi:FeS assembly SUF system regulator
MIKLGKLTDYAIVVMGQLAQEDAGASCSAHYLSGRTGVPEPTVAKVLKLLSGGGLLVATRGAAGGYKLSRPADRISIAEIITALDGPISIVACTDSNEKNCGPWPTCSVKGNWGRVNDAIKAALEGVKLKEMISPAPCGRTRSFAKDVNADSA